MEPRTRHVWVIPPLDVGTPKAGLVLTWRKRVVNASPPIWEAYVCYVDPVREDVRFEWIPSAYLAPAVTDPPLVGRSGHDGDRRPGASASL